MKRMPNSLKSFDDFLNEKKSNAEVIARTADEASVIKRTDNCAVFDGGGCVYKVKQVEIDDPLTCFENIIAQTFATEYNQMGIDWELSYATIGSKVYRVEKRQKLEVLDSNKMSFEEAVIKSSKLRRRVEKQLEIPRLFAQIHSEKGFEKFKKLILAREHNTDLSDFAIFDDQVVILGESNWFLGLLNCESKLDTTDTQRVVPVKTKYGEFFFAAQPLFKKKSAIGSALECSLKWWLFSKEVGDLEAFRRHMFDELESMATDNLRVLATKKHHVLKSKRDFGDVYSEMEKLGLLANSNVTMLDNGTKASGD